MFRKKQRQLVIDASHFTAGVVLEKDKVVRAAPILSYMQGWTSKEVSRFVASKGWLVREPDEEEAMT